MRRKGKNDVESEGSNGALRWAFIRKVYSIVTFQLLLTIAVTSMVVFVRPISTFLATISTTGHILHIVLLYIVLFIGLEIVAVLFPLYYYRQKHPLNSFLLVLFTITSAFGVGLWCALTKGKIILEAGILTSVVVVSLTLYTFWAARIGQDFDFLSPFLFGSLLVLIVCGFLQIPFPLGKIALMICGGLAAIIFCGYIVYDTDNLIKRHSDDNYIWASGKLCVDIVNIFVVLSILFKKGD